jgi:hypothetical protein
MGVIDEWDPLEPSSGHELESVVLAVKNMGMSVDLPDVVNQATPYTDNVFGNQPWIGLSTVTSWLWPTLARTSEYVEVSGPPPGKSRSRCGIMTFT